MYQEKLKALHAPSNAPKTLTYANAKRLALEASKSPDKAEKVYTAQETLRTAREVLAVATQQLRETESTRDKVFAAEAEANGKSLATNELKTTTICVDKVELGGEINTDFGELAAVIAEAPPEEQAKLKTMQEELATMLRIGFSNSLQSIFALVEEKKEQLLEARMQVAERGQGQEAQEH